MDWFWHTLVVCAIVIPVTIMWIAIAFELFRRRDLSGLQRATWLLLILLFPLIGSFAYLAVTWRSAKDGHDMQAVSGIPSAPATVADLTQLDHLRRSGVITEEEFERGKRRILEGVGP